MNTRIRSALVIGTGMFLLAGSVAAGEPDPPKTTNQSPKAKGQPTKKVIKIVTDKGGEHKQVFVTKDCDEGCEKAIVLQVETGKDGKTKVIKKKILDDKSGFLGVYLVALTKELRKHYSGDEEAGVLVGGLVPDSPALKAGIQVGDVIVAIDDKRVGSAMDIGEIVGVKKEGEKARVKVLRNGKPKVLAASVVEKRRHLKDLSEVSSCSKKGEEEECTWVTDPDKLGEQIEVEVREALEGIDLEELQKKKILMFKEKEKMQRELEEKLKKVEERLRELEKKLEGRLDKKPKGERTT